jgi:predicted RNA-binding protein YlxR (DUF448 family)
MLVRADHNEIDEGPRRVAPQRLCIATRTVRPVDHMIRFVVGPDGAIVPDIKGKLPGRGVWVTANRTALATAVSRKAFGRSFKREVRVAHDLAGMTEHLLERAALDALAIAHKAGRVAAGFAKVEAALSAEPVAALIRAADASPEGVRKLDAAVRRRLGEGTGDPAVIDRFSSTQLDLALGRSNVVHAALLAGPASAGFLARWRSLARFRSEDAGAEGRVAGGEKERP